MDGSSKPSSASSAAIIIRRNGETVPFDPERIRIAITKGILAVEGDAAASSARVRAMVDAFLQSVVNGLARRLQAGTPIHVEDVQDLIELAMMRSGEHRIARDYVLYRETRAKERAAAAGAPAPRPPLMVRFDAGALVPLDVSALRVRIAEAAAGLEVDIDGLLRETLEALYEEVTVAEFRQAPMLAARARADLDPAYSKVAARLLFASLKDDCIRLLGAGDGALSDSARSYAALFPAFIEHAIGWELLAPTLGEFDLGRLAEALDTQRDGQFEYLGAQTLFDRYFLHRGGTRFELPQFFFMRVAMGLASNEVDREARAIEFYQLLSSFDFMSSTPTLFNSGTLRPQLSSCYLSQVPDDLHGIFGAIHDNAMLSKYAGGLGNDWTPVRGMGGYIKGTNGKSNGVVPFLKVANDTAVAVNQGGKRKGAVCAYLETWHRDIEEFLELRKNVGDDRRRTHDMNTANWVPDLFMQRVCEEGQWTLFSPEEVPDLHDLYGAAFTQRYCEYEQLADAGRLRNVKRIPAVQLWRKMLSMLFETGHPWITFKDPCNIRSPQQHVGVVHSSNLCTEITLNTRSNEEIAVCNLGSVNLAAHICEGRLDLAKLERTIATAMRMLDNVIEYNYYSVPTARKANLRHRPVGLGLMGFQDALYKLRIPYEDAAAVEFADFSAEAFSYFAIKSSADLAAERGAYASFKGSLWSQGILPIDSIENLASARQATGVRLEQDAGSSGQFDWDALRQRVKATGLRNSNTMAIAPTATIANITGVSQSIEPTYQNLYVKSNLSGEFVVANTYLVEDLKALGLWDKVMVHDLKFYDGSVQRIDRIPDELKALYKCAFELDPRVLVTAGSRRQKWLDQSQSLNLYMAQPSGKKLDELYRYAWRAGLKTTYYLRTLGATHAEKVTVDDGRLNRVAAPASSARVCEITDGSCESCQ